MSATSSDSPTATRSTNHTPSGYSGRIRSATCTASLVLPQPPAPVRVSSRARPSSRWASASSRSRPTKLVTGVGRCPALAPLGFGRSAGARCCGPGGAPVSSSRNTAVVCPSGSVPNASSRSARSRSYLASASERRPPAASNVISARTAPSCSGSDSRTRDSSSRASSGVRSATADASLTSTARLASRSSSRRAVNQSADCWSGSRSPVYASAAERRAGSSPETSAPAASRSKCSTSTGTGPASSSTISSSLMASSPSAPPFEPASTRRATYRV